VVSVVDLPVRAGRKRKPRYKSSPVELKRVLDKHPGAPLAVDLETSGLDPHATPNEAIGAVICEVMGQAFILRELPAWWPELLADASRPKVLANARFDLMWMIEFCPDPAGLVHVRNVQDVMLKSQLVHDYRTRMGAVKAGRADLWKGNDLQSILAEFLAVEIRKSIDHEATDWTGPWSNEMIEYMLEDITFLSPLNDRLDELLLEQGQERAAWIEMNAVFASAFMGLNGIKPDVVAWEAAIEAWKAQHRIVLDELIALWPGVANFNSPKQIMATAVDVLNGPLLNTRKANLKQLAGDFPAVAKLLEQRHLVTRIKNWGPKYLENYVCRVCHRFHPNWRQIGTETSRPSCSQPNILQIPRAAEFRALFVAEPGYLIASLDYSAIEVLVAGVYADEPKLIEACATGDPHLQTARGISGNPHMTKASHPDERQAAKAANFGLLFGGGRDGLVQQARDMFDVVLSVDEAERIMQDFFALYPGLKKTRNDAYRAMDEEGDRITVENKVGFRRHLEGHNRKATSWLNTWIQSTAAYGMKQSFLYINEAGLTPFVLAQVYDEILFEFPEEHAEAFARKARACMVQGMRDVLGPNVPVIVAIDIGPTWV
jgi:DNA polymerase I